MARDDVGEPRWIEMPSINDDSGFHLEPGQNYHDLGEQYPDAPVPRGMRDAIVHRAVLDDITGVSKVMDWVSDGDLVIVEMSNLLTRELELQTTVELSLIHISEPTRLGMISYAVFCLKKKILN